MHRNIRLQMIVAESWERPVAGQASSILRNYLRPEKRWLVLGTVEQRQILPELRVLDKGSYFLKKRNTQLRNGLKIVVAAGVDTEP